MKPTTQLRDYQRRAIDDVRAAHAEVRSVVLQLPTGAGKTRTSAEYMREEVAVGHRCIFLAGLDTLVGDTHARLVDAGIRAGFVQAGRPVDDEAPIQVCSWQTLRARGLRPRADRVIVDECHHSASSTLREILAAYPSAKLLGMTATAQRGDGQPLGDIFERLVAGPSVSELTERGYLVPCELRAPGRVVDGALGMDPVDAYETYTPDRRALVFASGREHAADIMRKLAQRGIPAGLMLGDTPRAERERIRDGIVRGRLRVLVNVAVAVEGWDCPEIEVVILARSFTVCGSFLQAIGRGLRPAANKTKCVVLDLKGAWETHGLPDERRVWSLEGTAVRREALSAMAKCPECWAVFKPARECPRCHAALGAESRIRRIKTRAEKLDAVSHLSQSERDAKYLQTLRWVAENRVRIRSLEGQRKWALDKFRARWNREPEVAA